MKFKNFSFLSSMVLLSSFIFSASLRAEDAVCGGECLPAPTCHSLGYSKNAFCPEGYLTCPFDSSYKWCKTYTCADGRYQTENNSRGTCDPVSYHQLNCYNCDCADYPRTSCPAGAICETCRSTIIRYKVTGYLSLI